MGKWKVLCCAAVVSLLLGCLHAAAAASEGGVEFPDVNLEGAVREALQKPTGAITQEEIARLTELNASGRAIRDLTGIEHATGLKSLNLSDNEIGDVSQLGALAELETLILNGNGLSDVDGIGGLPSLTSLWLTNNQISDLRQLSSLGRLQHLYAAHNRVNSLAGLEELQQLTDLNLAGNDIQDVSPIRALSQLQTLNLGDNEISAIGGMEELVQLEWLSLANNPVTNITPLGGLSNLVYLNQRGYAVSADSRQVMEALAEKGGVVEYVLLIPEGAYIYDINLDGIADANDMNDAINFYLNLHDMKTHHPELKIAGNEIDPAALVGSTAFVYDVNRDGTADVNDVNAAINHYLNLDDMKNKHPEFRVVLPE
ncbi:leucine-rich repeat domain-containing protein [Paenibacillus xerothermodurans]|uniref:Leucine-rich repeat domain-containing protein n=1 Tax=Paenibacillus xerothermodurans TaxID=1977292 RepID=A0A2W1N8P6_PAEXE|nr:leucine-rich repeat protein [Paenibacillus xerothermodurans]PZE20020.1 hypothetical protein CBW46_015165 [Paenibacillus xerothermodurans]